MDDFAFAVLLGTLESDRTNYPLNQLLVFINGIVASDLPLGKKMSYAKQIKEALLSTPRSASQTDTINKIITALHAYSEEFPIY